VDSGVTRNGGVQIAYEDFGKPGGRPLLLISGLDSQMIGWADGFCEALVSAGFHVVRYDHRDSGLSTHFTGKKKAYQLTDMIDDLMAVIDARGWESANLVGLSMGGGLAQFAALLRPDRVRTVTAIRCWSSGHQLERSGEAGFAAKLPAGGISRITQPVLVLNGDEDPIVRPAAGRALARAVPHGRFVLVHRMGHMFSAPLWPELVSEIDQHAT
jgi:pimeloyl-ACP methyl ester carboxylesterase